MADKAARASKPRYRVNIGLNYPPNRRAEPGDVVDDLPRTTVVLLQEQGVIELVREGDE